MFHETNPGVIYARVNKTQVMRYTTGNGWNTYITQPIYDFANCLPANFNVKWFQSTWGTATPSASNLGQAHVWGSAFSEGIQDTAHWALAYKEPVGLVPGGCASIDTQNLLAYGWNGQLLGSLDDGNGNLLTAQFTIHDGSISRNPAYFSIVPSGGCQSGACDYMWEVGTTHVRPCTNLCDGHAAQGYFDRACHKNGSFLYLHPFSGPNSNLIGPLLNGIYPSSAYDDYGPNDFWRFGQTGNSGMSSFYTCQNAKGTVAELGDGIVFTSDMASDGSTAPLGTDSQGRPRCDIFWMELR
jgi:hypothetical protein